MSKHSDMTQMGGSLFGPRHISNGSPRTGESLVPAAPVLESTPPVGETSVGESSAPAGLSSNLSPQTSGTTESQDEKERGYTDLSDTERQAIFEAILNAPEDFTKIRDAWQSKIPEDSNIKFKHLLFILHPDKAPKAIEKEQADRAFKSKLTRCKFTSITDSY